MKSYRFSLRARLEKQFRAHVWPRLLRLATPLILIKRRLHPHQAVVERLTGKVRGADVDIEILCGLDKQIRHHVLKLIFENPPAVAANFGRLNVLKVFRAPEEISAGAGLALMPASESQHTWLDDGTWFSLPEWVRGAISLPLSEEVLRHDSVKTTNRLIRRHGYEYVIKRDEKAFEEFYYRMHEPYIRSIFGNEGACLDSFLHKRAASENFELILVQKKSKPGEYLTGFLIIYDPEGPRLWSLGVRDANDDIVREGGISALYTFCFQYLTERGFTTANVGGSRPFLRDGILNFKRRRAQRIIACQWESFGLKILRFTPGVKSFLLQNPFIFRSNGRPHGAIFADAPLTAEKIIELHHKFFHPGFGRLIIWVIDDGDTGALPEPPPELAGQVEVRPARELLAENLHLP